MSAERRSDCPVASTLDLLGDKWTLLVVRDMLFVGRSRFDEFLASPEGIATNILADRLARLTEAGLVEQRPNPDHKGRATYHLTDRGKSLRSVLLAMIDWGLEHLPGTQTFGVLPGKPRRKRGMKSARKSATRSP